MCDHKGFFPKGFMNFTQEIFLVGYAIKITKMILIFLKNEFYGSPRGGQFKKSEV